MRNLSLVSVQWFQRKLLSLQKRAQMSSWLQVVAEVVFKSRPSDLQANVQPQNITEGLNDMLTITSRCFDLDGANLIGRTSHIGSLKGRRQLGEQGEISSCCRDRMLVNQKLGTTGGRDANHIPNYLPKTLFWWQLVKHSVTQSNTILPSKAFHLICQFN